MEAILLRAESIWAINLCFFVKGRIQFWQVTWLKGDRNLAIITKTRFRFAESLAPPAKGSLRSPFASGGLSRLRRSCSRFALDFSRASGARIWVNCLESSLWQRLFRNTKKKKKKGKKRKEQPTNFDSFHYQHK